MGVVLLSSCYGCLEICDTGDVNLGLEILLLILQGETGVLDGVFDLFSMLGK